jgi:hypothetical protein
MTNPIKALWKAPYIQYRKLLLGIMVGQIAIIGILYGIDFSQKQIANWIHQEYTAPFLVQGPSIVQK